MIYIAGYIQTYLFLFPYVIVDSSFPSFSLLSPPLLCFSNNEIQLRVTDLRWRVSQCYLGGGQWNTLNLAENDFNSIIQTLLK